jgi:5-methylthioribose kinase
MTYEFLSAESIPDYIAGHAELLAVVDPSAISEIREVGDGNLNLVFIVNDSAGGSVVLKQALPYVRLVGPDWPMTPDRAKREVESLQLHGELAGPLVPQVYLFDSERYIIAMEDLSDHLVWRGALMKGLRHEGVAARMGEYVADVAFGTSVLAVDPEEHKRRVAGSINPELCTITEDLVFTEPYVEAERNSYLAANAPDVAALGADATMVREIGYAKWVFMTHAEALIHGDLHTGSVMVRAAQGEDGPVSSAKAFDSEFAFYGPVAFDLGALWANYTLAAARAVALGDDDLAEWSLDLATQTWDRFDSRFRELWPTRLDPRVFTDGFRDDLLDRWRTETWLFSAAKMARRIVGLAKVKDVETLDEGLREGAARGILAVARQAVRSRHDDSSPGAYAQMALGLLRENATRG